MGEASFLRLEVRSLGKGGIRSLEVAAGSSVGVPASSTFFGLIATPIKPTTTSEAPAIISQCGNCNDSIMAVYPRIDSSSPQPIRRAQVSHRQALVFTGGMPPTNTTSIRFMVFLNRIARCHAWRRPEQRFSETPAPQSSIVGELSAAYRVIRTDNKEEDTMGFGRGALLWLLGIPLPIILLLALFWHH